MTTPTLFKEYIWLVNTIHQARNISVEFLGRKGDVIKPISYHVAAIF